MDNLISYFKLAREELHKVIFPKKEQIRTAFVAVVSVVVVVSLFLAFIDLLMSFSISKFLA